MLTFADIEHLFATRGGEQYSGEPVTQLEHALQCALLAEQQGADDALVAAALLHDLGHLLHDLGETPTLRGVDDVHQYRAIPFLRGLFAEPVLGAIRLHVDAKRYLCATRPGYLAALSDDSKRSLALQGGEHGGVVGGHRHLRDRVFPPSCLIARLRQGLHTIGPIAIAAVQHYAAAGLTCSFRTAPYPCRSFPPAIRS